MSGRWVAATGTRVPAMAILRYLELLAMEPRFFPDSLSGGYAPDLQVLLLQGIPLLGLPKLLLSVTHLVDRRLLEIPLSVYFSVTVLSTLTSLRFLNLEA
jgi:hypothetical protein